MFDGIKDTSSLSNLENCDILSPQIREMYTALMQAGHITEALTLAREHQAEDTDVSDYLGNKRRLVYNLWIYNVAKALEMKSCNKSQMPCNLCLKQARDLGAELWVKMCQFLKDLAPHHWGTPWELLNILQKVLEAKPLITPPPTQESSLRIVKAPSLEEKCQ